jgi:hypothetical protein
MTRILILALLLSACGGSGDTQRDQQGNTVINQPKEK